MSDEKWQQYLQAEERARKVLRPGDRIVFTSCPGTKRHGVFQGWYGRTICIRTRDDISPRSICKVNGNPVDFTKPTYEEGVEIAAMFIDQRVAEYVQEHGVTDPETGTVEFPGWGDEYVSELEELAEGIRAIKK